MNEKTKVLRTTILVASLASISTSAQSESQTTYGDGSPNINSGRDTNYYQDRPKRPKTCRHPDFGRERWKQSDSVTQSSGWMGGGSNPTNWCNSLLSGFISNRGITGGYDKRFSNVSEQSKKDWKGHVEYNYHCTVTVWWDPLYRERTDPRCGTY